MVGCNEDGAEGGSADRLAVVDALVAKVGNAMRKDGIVPK